MVNSIDNDGPYGLEAAKKRLAEWLEQTQGKPVDPTPRNLFSNLS